MADTCTIGDLIFDTGEKARAIQHWSDLGILRPESETDKRGRGIARAYRVEPLFGERKYALIASAMNEWRLPLADVKHIVNLLRDEKFFAFYESAHIGGTNVYALIDVCPQSVRSPFMVTVLNGEQDLLALMCGKIAGAAILLNLSKIFAPLR